MRRAAVYSPALTSAIEPSSRPWRFLGRDSSGVGRKNRVTSAHRSSALAQHPTRARGDVPSESPAYPRALRSMVVLFASWGSLEGIGRAVQLNFGLASHRNTPSGRTTRISISCFLLAERAVRRPSGRWMPHAAHSRLAGIWTGSPSAANSRADERASSAFIGGLPPLRRRARQRDVREVLGVARTRCDHDDRQGAGE